MRFDKMRFDMIRQAKVFVDYKGNTWSTTKNYRKKEKWKNDLSILARK